MNLADLLVNYHDLLVSLAGLLVNYHDLLVNYHDLLVSLAGLLVNYHGLLVSFHDLLVNFCVTRELSRFTREFGWFTREFSRFTREPIIHTKKRTKFGPSFSTYTDRFLFILMFTFLMIVYSLMLPIIGAGELHTVSLDIRTIFFTKSFQAIASIFFLFGSIH
ncbi:hypothetical protein NST21_21720 [Peribacillus sp. FSL K6-1552]|uniref:hypothetical protein n=1 Tax=Peribacillus sp. FSL K6-1552 TaxID=2954514 RepID=UPI0030F63B1E